MQPAASAGPTLARLIWFGKFHGVIAATTPTASRRTVRRLGMPIGVGDAEVGLALVGLGQVGDPRAGPSTGTSNCGRGRA